MSCKVRGSGRGRASMGERFLLLLQSLISPMTTHTHAHTHTHSHPTAAHPHTRAAAGGLLEKDGTQRGGQERPSHHGGADSAVDAVESRESQVGRCAWWLGWLEARARHYGDSESSVRGRELGEAMRGTGGRGAGESVSTWEWWVGVLWVTRRHTTSCNCRLIHLTSRYRDSQSNHQDCGKAQCYAEAHPLPPHHLPSTSHPLPQ